MPDLADVANSLSVQGRLALNPTDLSKAYPHDGTDLGLLAGFELFEGKTEASIWSESRSGVVDSVISNPSPTAIFFIKGFDNNAVDTFLYSRAGGSGAQIIQARDNEHHLGSDSSFKILFSPRRTSIHPAVLLFSTFVIPPFSGKSSFSFNLKDQLGKMIGLRIIPNSDGYYWDIGMIADLTL